MLHDEMKNAWCRYVLGDYEQASNSLAAIFSDAEITEETARYINFFRPCGWPMYLSKLGKVDPFLKRAKFATGKLSVAQCMEMEQYRSAFLSEYYLEGLVETIFKNTEADQNRLHLLFISFQSCLRASAFSRAEDCLDSMLDIASTLDPFDFAEFCDNFGVFMQQCLDLTTDGTADHKAKEQALFFLARGRKLWSWLRNCNVERIPNDFWTEPLNWRERIAKRGLLLFQTYAKSDEYFQGSLVMDSIIEALKEGVYDKSLFYLGEDSPKGLFQVFKDRWINVLDESVTLTKRRFLLQEILRLQCYLRGNDHPIVVKLQSELARISPTEAIVINPSIAITSEDRIAPIVRQSSSHMNYEALVELEKKRHAATTESLLSYLRRKWGEYEDAGEVIVTYRGRGSNWIQFAYIEKPNCFTDQLTPERVSTIINVVNSASGRVLVHADGGSRTPFFKLNDAKT